VKMDANPFISVVIPTYNRLGFLKETLKCLEQQTYPSNQYEIIVVDDGSGDGTEVYLRRAAAQGRLRYIRQENRGPAAARNKGVQVAHGEIVAFTDDDCLPDTNWLKHLVESYKSYNNSSPVAVGGHIENVSEGHWLYPFYAVQCNRHQANQSEKPRYLDTANASFDRHTFLKLGGFDESFPFPSGEDVDLGFRFLAADYELNINPYAVVQHKGDPSLKGMVKQSFNRGRGNALLKSKHPTQFTGSSSHGLRLKIKNFLNNILHLSFKTPRILRPFICGVVASVRQTAFFLPETEHFIHIHLAKQISRYQAMELRRSRRFYLYILLEWIDYLAQLVGQIVGIFGYAYNQAKNDCFIPSRGLQRE